MRRAAIVVLLLIARVASAHQTSIKYVDIAVADRIATIRFTVAPSDLTIPLGLPPESQPDLQQALDGKVAVAAYVASWLTLPDCAPTPADATGDPDGKFVVVTWRATCAAPIERTLSVDLTRFFALDARHQAIVTVHADDTATGEPAIVRAAQPVVALVLGARPSVLAWVRYGMDHIYTGRDHIAFVLALLLVVMLARDGEQWITRKPRDTLARTAKIVTAFTVAHSISLILASLGYIQLPSRFVESTIAVSIAYTAIEDIVRPDVRWRYILTFGFGLVHGLGFASALQELLPTDHVIVPLLAFNVGVELGQLTIVLVALPLFWLAARELTATRYRRTVMPALASVIFALGVVWLIERLGNLTILGM